MSPDEADFLDRFEAAAIPKEEFDHRAHVRVAWLYLRRYGLEEAGDRMAAGIRRFAAAHGATGKYHETITQAWVRLVAASIGDQREFADFVAANPELLDKELPNAYYSAERLWSDEARRAFVEPDRRPLP
jgi:hypothetical protein